MHSKKKKKIHSGFFVRREVKEKIIKKLPKSSKRKMMKTWTRVVWGVVD